MQAPQLFRSVLAATAFAGVMAAPAQALVVTYTGPAISIPNNIDGLYLNVLTGATNLVTGFAPSGWDVNIYNNNAGLTFFANTASAATVVGSGNAASALLAGAVVGPTSSFGSNNPLGGGIDGLSFQAGGDRFFGFRFTNETTGGVHYGWGLLRTTAGDGFPAQLLSYAYENVAGAPITVVPEPGTYALMLAGLAGIAGFAARRRKAN